MDTTQDTTPGGSRETLPNRYALQRQKKRDLQAELRQVDQELSKLEPELIEHWADTRQPKGQTIELENGEQVKLYPSRKLWANAPQIAADPELDEWVKLMIGGFENEEEFDDWANAHDVDPASLHYLLDAQQPLSDDENVAIQQARRRHAFEKHGIDVLLMETVNTQSISSWAREKREEVGALSDLESMLDDDLKPYVNLAERTTINARFEKG